MYTNAPLPMAIAALRQVNLAERAGDLAQQAEAYAGIFLATQRLPLVGVLYLRLAHRLVVQAQHPVASGVVAMLSSLYYLGQGRFALMRQQLPVAIALLEGAGNRRQWEKCVSLLATGELYAGNFRQAAQYYADAHNSALRRGDVQNQIGSNLGRAACLIFVGRPAQALPLLETAQELLAKYPETGTSISLWGLLTLAHWQCDAPIAAAAAATEAIREITATAAPLPTVVVGHIALGEVLLARWQRSDDALALAQLRWLVTMLQRLAQRFPVVAPPTLRLAGYLAWFDGNGRGARRLWQRSLQTSIRLDMLHDRALAQRALDLAAHTQPKQV